MIKFRHAVCGVYMAIDRECNMYAGMSADMQRRANQHSHNGKTVIDQFPIDCRHVFKVETRMIHFLQLQSQEEEFKVINAVKLIPSKELERRYGQDYKR